MTTEEKLKEAMRLIETLDEILGNTPMLSNAWEPKDYDACSTAFDLISGWLERHESWVPSEDE